jgi:hypothetical protein
VLLYRWAAEENFWPAQTGLDFGPFQNDAGRDGFLRNAQRALREVRQAGLFQSARTPRVGCQPVAAYSARP